MKFKIHLSAIYFFFFSNFLIAQVKLEGVDISNTYKADKDELILNGAGVREKYFIDLYVAALYLKQKSHDAKAIVDADETMAMKISIISSMITSAKMEESIREGFKKSTKGASNFQSSIDAFVKALSEDVKKGDHYVVVYLDDTDIIQVYKGTKLKTEMKGLDFKKALFGIWLGADPVDHDLKKSLVGK